MKTSLAIGVLAIAALAVVWFTTPTPSKEQNEAKAARVQLAKPTTGQQTAVK